MRTNAFGPEQITAKLRPIEVAIARGRTRRHPGPLGAGVRAGEPA